MSRVEWENLITGSEDFANDGEIIEDIAEALIEYREKMERGEKPDDYKTRQALECGGITPDVEAILPDIPELWCILMYSGCHDKEFIKDLIEVMEAVRNEKMVLLQQLLKPELLEIAEDFRVKVSPEMTAPQLRKTIMDTHSCDEDYIIGSIERKEKREAREREERKRKEAREREERKRKEAREREVREHELRMKQLDNAISEHKRRNLQKQQETERVVWEDHVLREACEREEKRKAREWKEEREREAREREEKRKAREREEKLKAHEREEKRKAGEREEERARMIRECEILREEYERKMTRRKWGRVMIELEFVKRRVECTRLGNKSGPDTKDSPHPVELRRRERQQPLPRPPERVDRTPASAEKNLHSSRPTNNTRLKPRSKVVNKNMAKSKRREKMENGLSPKREGAGKDRYSEAVKRERSYPRVGDNRPQANGKTGCDSNSKSSGGSKSDIRSVRGNIWKDVKGEPNPSRDRIPDIDTGEENIPGDVNRVPKSVKDVEDEVMESEHCLGRRKDGGEADGMTGEREGEREHIVDRIAESDENTRLCENLRTTPDNHPKRSRKGRCRSDRDRGGTSPRIWIIHPRLATILNALQEGRKKKKKKKGIIEKE